MSVLCKTGFAKKLEVNVSFMQKCIHVIMGQIAIKVIWLLTIQISNLGLSTLKVGPS